MAGLYRVGLALALALWSMGVSALVPFNGTWSANAGAYGDPGNTQPGPFATAQAACDAYRNRQATAIPGWTMGPGTLTGAAPPPNVYGSFKCQVYFSSSGGALNQGPMESGIFETPGTTCPANSTAASGGCQCTSPYVQNAGATACEIPNPCAALAGKDAGDVSWNSGPTSGSPTYPDYTYCDGWQPIGEGKCTATASRDVAFGVDGKWISQGRAKYTGQAASGQCNGDGATGSTPTDSVKPPGTDPAPPVKPPEGQAAPAPCPQGQQAGEVNGTRVCAATGPETPVRADESREVKNPDGSSTTTNGTTTCKDGKCTRDETTCTKPSGGTQTCGGTTTTTESLGSYCAKNAGAKVCVGEGSDGSFNGDCVAGFKVNGEDAVLNAMALEQHKRNCEILAKTSPEATAVAAASDPSGTTKATNPNDSTVVVSASNFDTSNALGGGGCSLNKTITVAGRSATLPFNVLCDPLAVLGQLLVVVSLLAAARIVARG